MFLHGGNYTSDVYVDNIKVLDSEGNDMLNGAGNFYSEVLAQEYEYYADITGFRGETKTAPAKAGYLFAGWYQDAACTKALPEETTSGAAYAKFVDEDVLAVYGQIKSGTTETSKDIRFVTTVDSLDYQKVGFKIAIGENTPVTKEITTVYKKLYAARGSQEIDTLAPSKTCSPISTYFTTYAYWDVPEESYDTLFTVTPYWITLDGTMVEGVAEVKSVRMGL